MGSEINQKISVRGNSGQLTYNLNLSNDDYLTRSRLTALVKSGDKRKDNIIKFYSRNRNSIKKYVSSYNQNIALVRKDVVISTLSCNPKSPEGSGCVYKWAIVDDFHELYNKPPPNA